MNAWEQYAFDVQNGTIPACKRLKQAVKRYHNDLNNPIYTFDSEVVARFGDCIDDDRIRDDILEDSQHFDIKLVGFDTWNATHLRTQLQGAGLDVEPFPQTYMRFSPVAKSAEVFVNRKVIRHNGDPVLSWAMSNVVMETDANANIKPNKKKSANKIDPAIAFLMSFGTWQAEHEEFAFSLSDDQKQRLTSFDGV